MYDQIMTWIRHRVGHSTFPTFTLMLYYLNLTRLFIEVQLTKHNEDQLSAWEIINIPDQHQRYEPPARTDYGLLNKSYVISPLLCTPCPNI